ncbi:MAG TPA: PKD domain-containing protein, partial [Candidatus Limnocylindrales bacterium]|nr:PKD domain-containing protein [Candidatus Limnocylindrales bacterium]
MRFLMRALAVVLLGTCFSVTALAGTDPQPVSSATETADGNFRPAQPWFGHYSALTPPSNALPAPSSSDEDFPRVELFGGYSYIRLNVKGLTPALNQNFNNHGGTGAVALNVNRWFGLVADFGAYRVSDLPSGVSGSQYTFLFGPQFSFRHERWTPFLHALFGADRVASKVTGTNTGFFNSTFNENKFAMALGGGFDLNLGKHLAWRVVQAEYLLTKFVDANNNQQNNIRAATGLVVRFGGAAPPPPAPVNHPPTISITPNPSKLTEGSGDSSVIQAKAQDPDNDTLTYTWSATGGTIEGSGPEVHWNPAGLKPGTYTITSKVDDGKGGTASSSADVTIEARPNRNPTVTCAAAPPSVTAGQPVTITATGSDPDNDPLTYSYSATGGTVSGTGPSGNFNTTGLKPGNYTVTCKADDGRGGTAQSTTNVEVQAPAEQKQLEVRLSLHSIYFPT